MSSDWIDSIGRMDATPVPRDLAEPLAVMQLALRSPGEAKVRFSDYRFSRLVASRLQLNDLDMASFSEILKLGLASPSMDQSRPFNYQLRYVVTCYGLQALFNDDGPEPYHHAIRPTGYDFHLDAVLPPPWKDGAPTIAKWRTIARCSPPQSFGSIAAERTAVGCAAFLVPGTSLMRSRLCDQPELSPIGVDCSPSIPVGRDVKVSSDRASRTTLRASLSYLDFKAAIGGRLRIKSKR